MGSVGLANSSPLEVHDGLQFNQNMQHKLNNYSIKFSFSIIKIVILCVLKHKNSNNTQQVTAIHLFYFLLLHI